jgi:3-oxoacyl-[acyl-carrier protein] reductase
VNAIDLKNRHAIVTGAAQGIGFSIAQRLLTAGASVSLWDRDESSLSEAMIQIDAKERSAGRFVDVTDPLKVDSGVEREISEFGKIDILVANAGVAGPNYPTWAYPIHIWREIIEINLFGVYLCCRAVVPHMINQRYGRIVNVASIAGKEGNPNASAYSASKAGVIALTKSLGKETADMNIAVNCITPAAARTKIFEQMTQEHIDFMLSRIPRKRFLEVDEVAAMVSWLVSEENSFTTGAVFDLSGGRATY